MKEITHLPLTKPVFKLLAKAAEQTGVKAWVVGGYVRDYLLEIPSKDIDIVTESKGIELAKAFANLLEGKKKVSYFKNFGTAQVIYQNYEIEFVGARKESYNRNSRKPVVEDGTLLDDQLRRDFTVNALSASLNAENYGEIIDPFNGIEDLKKKILKTPTDPDKTFSDDPLRMLRGIRFASKLFFSIDYATFESIKRNVERIDIVSMERISDEMNKMIMTTKPSIAFNLMFDSGLLKIILPEVQALYGVEVKNGISHKDNFYHTLKVLDNVSELSDNLWLRWAAIMHDIAKPPTKRFNNKDGWTFHGHEDKGSRMTKGIFKRLKLPLNEHMKYVQKLVLLHLRPIALTKNTVTDSAIRRLIVDVGDDMNDLLLLCQSDITSKNERKVKKYLSNLVYLREKIKEVEERDQLRNFQPPITGKHIMDTFVIKDPPQIGTIKTAVREAILEGTIANDFDEAFDYMKKVGKELGVEFKSL